MYETFTLRRNRTGRMTAEVRERFERDGVAYVRYIERWDGEFRYEHTRTAEIFDANYC